MLAAWITNLKTSSQGVPTVINEKKDNIPIFCVDYWALNNIIRVDKISFRNIDDVASDIAGSECFGNLEIFAH